MKNVAVVGGGFIGIEVAENLAMAKYNVHIIEGADQIMAPFDYDMVQTLHKELLDNNVSLHLNSNLIAIYSDSVVASRQEEAYTYTIPAEAVVMAIGVAPETTLARNASLEIGETRGIKVNHNYQTSDPDIYAVGDAIESYNRLTHDAGRLALAGPAQRQSRAAADHMYGIPHNNRGYIGSSCIKVFGLNAASTSLNEKMAKKAGIPYDSVYVLPSDKVGIMPNSNYLCFKLIFEVPTGRILGAQAIGKGNADKRIDVIAAMIHINATLEDLKELELCYSPVFGTAKDVVNMAALVGLNILYGRSEQVPVTKARELVETGAYIVDVREKAEYERGHLKGAVNIPLSELRDRIEEIPKDIPVYVHCRTSQRSYNALMCLKGNGYKNAKNIAGSFLGICLYEYYNDVALERDPIVTDYNFN